MKIIWFGHGYSKMVYFNIQHMPDSLSKITYIFNFRWIMFNIGCFSSIIIKSIIFSRGRLGHLNLHLDITLPFFFSFYILILVSLSSCPGLLLITISCIRVWTHSYAIIWASILSPSIGIVESLISPLHMIILASNVSQSISAKSTAFIWETKASTNDRYNIMRY